MIIHLGHVLTVLRVFNLPAATEKGLHLWASLISSSVWTQLVTSRMSMSHISLSQPVPVLMPKQRGFPSVNGENNFSPAGLCARVNPLGFLEGSPWLVPENLQIPRIVNPGQEFPADEGTLLGCCAELSVHLQHLRALPCRGALPKLKALGATGRSQNLDPWSKCGHNIWNSSLTHRSGKFYQIMELGRFSWVLSSLGCGGYSRRVLSAGLLRLKGERSLSRDFVALNLLSPLIQPHKHLSSPSGWKAGAQEC